PTQAWIAGKSDEPSTSVNLQVSFVGGRGIDADHAKRLVLEEVLSEKLFDLRARTALSYVTEASYMPRRAGGVWSLTAVVDRARAAEAGTELVRLLDQLRSAPETYRVAFVIARQKVLEGMLATSGSSLQALNRLVETARFDVADDRHDRLVAEIAALTLPTFHTFVAHELARTGQVFSAYGNSEAVSAALDAARQADQAPVVGANERAR
ncbi:MAG TPA: hypothetical protein VGC42_03155, partial [Kofleriaceae bacterium]